MSEDDTTAHSSKRRPFLKAGAGAVAVSLAGCTGDESEATQTETAAPETESTPDTVDEGEEIPTGGNFRFGMSQPPAGLNPLTVNSAYSGIILGELLGYGTTTEPVNTEVKPSAFSDWEVQNVDSGEPDVYFNVREELTWSDGTEFTIEDVIFTYDYMLENNPGRYAGTLAEIKSVDRADNDWDVHMVLKRPVGTYASSQLSLPMLPKHRWEGVEMQEYEPHQNTYEVDGTEYMGPVGLGPGRLTRYEPDTSVEVTYRDDYELSKVDWLQEHDNLRSGGPFLDSLRVLIYGSSEALQQAFISNDDIDAMYGSVLPANVADVEDKDGARIVTGSDTSHAHVSFNMRNQPLDCTAFRQVMSLTFDQIFWTQQLNRGYAERGNYFVPPGYRSVRPETEVGAEPQEPKQTNALDFVQAQPSLADIEAIKEFLRESGPITGEGGTYADGARELPESLTGATTDHSEPQYEYTWGEVQSDVLDEEVVDEEIRIDGQTVEELIGRPLELKMTPPQDSPLSTQMYNDWINTLQLLGIPVERDVMTFNTMVGEVYYKVEGWDMYPMGWVNLSTTGITSAEGLYHSDQAHGLTEADSAFASNAMGYGLEGLPGADDMIDEAMETMDTDERNSLTREVIEKIYLDAPSIIRSYDIPQWPVNSGEFQGFLEGIPGPGTTYAGYQFQNIHLNE